MPLDMYMPIILTKERSSVFNSWLPEGSKILFCNSAHRSSKVASTIGPIYEPSRATFWKLHTKSVFMAKWCRLNPHSFFILSHGNALFVLAHIQIQWAMGAARIPSLLDASCRAYVLLPWGPFGLQEAH